jgi:hypothetical protein
MRGMRGAKVAHQRRHLPQAWTALSSEKKKESEAHMLASQADAVRELVTVGLDLMILTSLPYCGVVNSLHDGPCR